MIKERARYTPSQTVFHNVCSGAHRALFFVCLIQTVQSATGFFTRNGVPQVKEERDIFLRKLIQWLGLLRNMSRSFCIGVIQSIWVPQVFYSSLRSSENRLQYLFGAHRALFCLYYLDSTIRHKAATPNCVPQGESMQVILKYQFYDGVNKVSKKVIITMGSISFREG